MADKSQTEQDQLLWLNERHLDYHRRQFFEPYRSTIHLQNFIAETIGDCGRPMDVLDVGSGAGANIYHLSSVLTKAEWTAVDINERLFKWGERLMVECGFEQDRIRFMAADFNHLRDHFAGHSFDIVLSMQTLSWLPNYDQILPELFSMVKPSGMIYVSSLFTNSLTEARIQITQFEDGSDDVGEGPYFYNIYCFDRFEQMCLRLGASEVRAIDFDIDRDLPEPEHRHMGTYTKKMTDGTRMQCSGPLLMPWKFIAIYT